MMMKTHPSSESTEHTRSMVMRASTPPGDGNLLSWAGGTRLAGWLEFLGRGGGGGMEERQTRRSRAQPKRRRLTGKFSDISWARQQSHTRCREWVAKLYQTVSGRGRPSGRLGTLISKTGCRATTVLGCPAVREVGDGVRGRGCSSGKSQQEDKVQTLAPSRRHRSFQPTPWATVKTW